MPEFEMYDVLEIDWGRGEGWQQYFVCKSHQDFADAARVVRGAVCPSAPHWIARSAMRFRLVSDRGVVKLTEGPAGGPRRRPRSPRPRPPTRSSRRTRVSSPPTSPRSGRRSGTRLSGDAGNDPDWAPILEERLARVNARIQAVAAAERAEALARGAAAGLHDGRDVIPF